MKAQIESLVWERAAHNLHYAPLPEELVAHAEQKIKSIKSAQ